MNKYKMFETNPNLLIVIIAAIKIIKSYHNIACFLPLQFETHYQQASLENNISMIANNRSKNVIRSSLFKN